MYPLNLSAFPRILPSDRAKDDMQKIPLDKMQKHLMRSQALQESALASLLLPEIIIAILKESDMHSFKSLSCSCRAFKKLPQIAYALVNFLEAKALFEKIYPIDPGNAIYLSKKFELLNKESFTSKSQVLVYRKDQLGISYFKDAWPLQALKPGDRLFPILHANNKEVFIYPDYITLGLSRDFNLAVKKFLSCHFWNYHQITQRLLYVDVSEDPRGLFEIIEECKQSHLFENVYEHAHS